MISREEAIEFFDTTNFTGSYGRQSVNKIYDSIGSCDVCKYLFSIDMGLVHRCKLNHDTKGFDWFCADFKRKEDDK